MGRREERRKKHRTKRDRKQEKKTFLLGDAKFIQTTRTNCGVGSANEACKRNTVTGGRSGPTLVKVRG